MKATIDRYKKAHACGSTSGAPLIEVNAQVTHIYVAALLITFFYSFCLSFS